MDKKLFVTGSLIDRGRAKIPSRSRRRLGLFISPMLVLIGTSAAAVDIDPGDYLPPPPGTDLLALYGIHAFGDQLQTNNSIYRGGASLTADAALLRAVHFTRIGNLEIDPQIFIPVGSTHTRFDGVKNQSSTRRGDIAIASSAYLINKHGPIPTVFGITPFLYMPTGSYDHNQPLNQGENRWKAILQAGLVQGVTPSLTLELAGDVTFYGPNKAPYGGQRSLRQSDTYHFQGILRRNISSKTALSLGYSATLGGKSFVDGIYSGTRTQSQQIRAFVATQFEKKTNLEVGLSRDVKVVDGYRTAIAVRIRFVRAI